MESIILYLLAICYYTFCVTVMLTYKVKEVEDDYLYNIFYFIGALFMAPIIIPIALGIILADKLEDY